MDFQPLNYIWQPAAGATHTLLLLHGTGGDERDLLPLAKRFGGNLNVLSLRGNVLEGGMPRFFRRLGMGVFDEDDLRFRTAEMLAFLQQLALKEGFDARKVIALGYSNGANIIGSVLMQAPDVLAGAIMFRPMLPFKAPTTFRSNGRHPVFMSNGDHDPTIRSAETAAYSALLKEAGYNVTDVSTPAGHELSYGDVQQAQQWFAAHFGQAIKAG